jgi:hypothetical protein
MRRFGWTVSGLILGAALVFAVGMALPSIVPLSQAEGAYAMGVAFFWTPLGALVGALSGFLLSRGRA